MLSRLLDLLLGPIEAHRRPYARVRILVDGEIARATIYQYRWRRPRAWWHRPGRPVLAWDRVTTGITWQVEYLGLEPWQPSDGLVPGYYCTER